MSSSPEVVQLTPEQEAKLPSYMEKWLKIGEMCDPCDFERARDAATRACIAAGFTPPPQDRFYVQKGPISAAYCTYLLDKCPDQDPMQQMPDKDSLDQSIRDCMLEHTRHMTYGSQDAPWLSFYDFVIQELDLEVCKPLQSLLDLAQSCGWWASYDVAVILQDRHEALHLNARGDLHKDGDMAVYYRDNYGLYFLNGVWMPENVVMTPADDLDPKLIFEETNVEVRREIVRKIGPTNLFRKLGAQPLDTEDGPNGYQLVEFKDIGAGTPARALKMNNRSLEGVVHIEFVPNSCNTVMDALLFRNGFTADQIDDVNGADWEQQGDVLVIPRGATKFKSRPSILT